MLRHTRWFGAAAVCLALGCDSLASDPATTVAPQPETTGVESSTGDLSGTTEAPPLPGDDLACNPWVQNCPAGDKCALYAKDGSEELNAARCVAMPLAPRKVDESCVAGGGYGNGVDDCDAGLMCWGLGPNDQGVCVPLCNGCDPEPSCPDGRLCAQGIGNFHFMCLPECDPLLQNCIEGDECVLVDRGFVCVQDQSATEGQIYDACEHANACDAGLVCAPPGSAPGCTGSESQGCCLPFCAVGGEACPDGLECVYALDPGQFPEFSEVGLCVAAP